MLNEKRSDIYLLRSIIKEILNENKPGSAIKVGDLKKAIKIANDEKQMRKLKKHGLKAAETGLKYVLAHTPGGTPFWAALIAARSLSDLYNSTMNWEHDLKEQDPLWDMLSIDPEKATILDDRIERTFIEKMGKKVDTLDDDSYLPNIDDQLELYLRDRFDGSYIKKDKS